MYRVVIWDTNEILDEFENLATAKKVARDCGHSGDGTDTQFSPIARVDGPMEDGSPGYGVECNPRFYRGKHDNFKAIPYVKAVALHIETISNGLGSQSVRMLVLAAEGFIPAKLSITADTGSENDCLWSTGERTTAKEYFDRIVKPYAADHGIEAVFVRANDKSGNPLPPLIERMKIVDGPAGVPMFGSGGGRITQGCTGKYKVRAIRQELRRRGATTARIAIGLTISETERMKISDVKWNTHYWPLIDLKLYRSMIQDDLTARGIPYLVSTQCDMCPHKDWARWERTNPETIERIEALENSLPGLFFTDQRIPLQAALDALPSQTSLFDVCDSGYCFT